MEEVTTPDPIVEIALPDPEPVVQPTTENEIKIEELSPSNPTSVDNSETPQTTVTSDNLVTSEVQAVPAVVPAPQRDALGQFVEGNTESVGNQGGRPCEFCKRKDEVMAIANKYIEKCKRGVDGKPIMPYKEELAMELNIIDTTLHGWAIKVRPDGSLEHPEFSDLWAMLNMLQKLRLQQRTMGRYNPTGAIALLKWHHGMIETSKQILAGDIKEPLEIRIIEEDREKYQE